jgi:hypothetical protein
MKKSQNVVFRAEFREKYFVENVILIFRIFNERNKKNKIM